MADFLSMPFGRVGGSDIGSERVSGPPSKTYPILRDLATGTLKHRDLSDPTRYKDSPVYPLIEIDTDIRRYVGRIVGYDHRGEERIYLADDHTRFTIKFPHIIAFRVLKLEVKEQEAWG